MAQNGSGFGGCDHRGTAIRDREFLALSGSAATRQISGPDTAETFLRPTQRAETDLEAWKEAIALSSSVP
ncbi:hypothetical protein HNR31_003095 [Anoxybacillus caldiproteolyticus]|uniref:Uncharacterized protein n=1 Tax=Thermaerobacillus caldiproteolyticus TaxID=247480 RepID=A0A7V9Z990_9BACL|nr:hypothetical protein [Anoxybacillus caldiproteolyticus]